MPKVLAIADRVKGQLEEGALELLGAAKALGAETVAAAVIGSGVGDDAKALADGGFDVVHAFDDASLAQPDGEAWQHLLRGLIEREGYDVVLLGHSNVALDYAPGLAMRLDRPLLTDTLTLTAEGSGFAATRAVFGGKLHAQVEVDGTQLVATIRGGAFEAGAGGAGEVKAEALPADMPTRRRFVKTVEPDPSEVDISQAEVIVGVGRGIEEEENLEIVQSLAKALGGEVACSRPVVDKGWLSKTRQVGTSGVTVKPRVYVAVGISGSFQHVGGIKGSPFVVAVNKDARAPIFGFADVGIVGDLFDVVPALEEKIREAKG